MEFNLYKVKEGMTKTQLRTYFSTEEYETSEVIEIKGTKIEGFYENVERNNPKWLDMVEEYFDLEVNLGENINLVLLIELPSSVLFLMPFGRGYTKIGGLIDFEFGMDFAERQLETQHITGKKIDYYLQNKIREVSTIQEEWIESAIPNQSYAEVVGTPSNPRVFGKVIKCSDKVNLKAYGETPTQKLEDIVNKVYEVNEALRGPKNNTGIPRINPVKNSDMKLQNKLFTYLNKCIHKDEIDNYNIVYIGLLSENNFLRFSDLSEVDVYYERATANNKVELNNIQDLIDYLKESERYIEDLKAKTVNEEGENPGVVQLIDYLDITLNYQGDVYIHTRNRWHYLNATFVDLLEKQLDEIEVDLNTREFKVDVIKDEDDYVNQIEDKGKMNKLHKIMVKGLSTEIELADLHDQADNELYAVKVGLETGKTIYSLQQALLAMSVLKSNDEYDFSNFDRKGYDIEAIKRSNQYSIIWVLVESENKNHATARMYLDSYDEQNLKLKDINSMLVKLKISEWYQFCKQSGVEPKIYFTKTIKEKTEEND